MLPLCREIDLPASLHSLLPGFRDWGYPMLLESSMAHPRLGRYSYLVAGPSKVIRSKNGTITIGPSGAPRKTIEESDPFAELRRALAASPMDPDPDLPPFQGGAVGYFAYDLAHHTESLPRTAQDDLAIPDMVVGLYDWVLAHEHATGRSWIISAPPDGDIAGAEARMEAVVARVRAASAPEQQASGVGAAPPISSNFTHQGYVDAVRQAKEYIAAGDIYQVNLSQRLEAPLSLSPWDFYSRLREVSPVTYGAYLDLGEFVVASASPELFLRKDGRAVETRPIKGTRPRGRSDREDSLLIADLLASEKDRAENVMIVDLLRNDIGKACSVGSVHVPELFSLESYSTVHHLVSAVMGELADGQDAVSLLKACFPGGSITGCPKIRSMEIIDELEPTQRGVYCGAIGFIGFNGNMDTSITIRTAVLKDGRAYYQVGGAIVADSDPEGEYQETLDKARAFILALGGGGD